MKRKLSLNSPKMVHIATDHSALRYIRDPTLDRELGIYDKTSAEQGIYVPRLSHLFAELLSKWGYNDDEKLDKTG